MIYVIPLHKLQYAHHPVTIINWYLCFFAVTCQRVMCLWYWLIRIIKCIVLTADLTIINHTHKYTPTYLQWFVCDFSFIKMLSVVLKDAWTLLAFWEIFGKVFLSLYCYMHPSKHEPIRLYAIQFNENITFYNLNFKQGMWHEMFYVVW